jgi:serine/threonine protein kinase/WD40 repeat protein
MAKHPTDAEAIFLAALDKASPQERAAYVDGTCEGDSKLLRRVRELLVFHEGPQGPLDAPPPGLRGTAGLPPMSEEPGMVIGPYKLLQQIGEGGMGTVYMAEQTEPVRRKVALKVIKPGMDSRQVVARFEAERQALAIMDHANIARVFDGGTTAAGRPYFVMELVHGVPITKYCDDHHLTPRERLGLFVPVCRAIQHAHQKGIVHRDLKPSNVMVTLYDGKPVPKVIDFGVAKATEQKLTERTLFTQYGTLVGTLEYMSPEQAEMSTLGVDTRSDIFSLGVLLYELLTGGTPLTRKRMQEAAYGEVLRMIREEEPPKPSTRLSDSGEALASISARRRTEPAKLAKLMRGELDWIVMKCLEKDRARRYETADAFAADVQRYLNDEPVQACPPSAVYRLRKFARRHRGPVLAATLVVLALVGGVVGTTRGMVRATAAKADAESETKQKQDALLEREVALTAARQSQRAADEKLFESYVNQARAYRLSRRPGQRFESLDALHRATELARRLDLPAERFYELRNAVIASLALPDLHLTGPWTTWPADTFWAEFDEAQGVCARTDWRGTCIVRRVADDAELYHLAGRGVPAWPHLSRDGKVLAVRHNRNDRPDLVGGGVQLWALDGPTPRLIHSEDQCSSVEFHPDGQRVGITSADGSIRFFEVPGGRPVGPALAPTALTREVKTALHPTEPLVAVSSYFGRVVEIRDLRTGRVVASLPQAAGVTHAAWHPDGRTLAVGHPDPPLIRLYDRTTWRPFRTLDGGGANFTFNHAGDRLAGRDWTGACGLFDVGTGQRLFLTPPGNLAPCFSPDDRRLTGGSRDGRLGTWQVGDGREYRTLVRNAPAANVHYQSVALHPDGRLLACGMADGLGLWDLASGSELAFVPLAGEGMNGVSDVRFEPSGALLTAGVAGLLRWPIRPGEPKPPGPGGTTLIVGPPERLLPRAVGIGQSKDGGVIVACNRAVGAWEPYAGGWVLRAGRPNQPLRLDAGADIQSVAVSPDDHWVVTVTHALGLAKIWDARDGRLVKQADWGINYYPRFSPDGRWLSTGADGGRIFAVGTWEPGLQVGAGGAFAPDSRLMAVDPLTGAARLVDRGTGRELARLEDPDSYATSFPQFTPDGTKLIGVSRLGDLSKGIGVWDLRLIRRHLKSIGLDWDYPEMPPPPAGGKADEPLTVTLLPGDLGEPAATREEAARQAIARRRRALDANPDDAAANNHLAWAYLTAPEPLRDVKTALPLAEKAVRLAADNGVYRNTLGVAYYRAGRYRESIRALRPPLDKQADWCLAFDLYVLAMSHQRLGETARARDYYDWAVRWPRSYQGLNGGQLKELEVFRAEAAGLMGIEATND